MYLAKTWEVLLLKRSSGNEYGEGSASSLCNDHQNYPLITWEIKAFSDEQKLEIYYQLSLIKETSEGCTLGKIKMLPEDIMNNKKKTANM